MIRLIYFSLLIFACCGDLCAQQRTFYDCPSPTCVHWLCAGAYRGNLNLTFSWGYNRATYTTSNVRVYGDGYDFRLWDLKAKDRPTPVGLGVYINPATISIPQYNWQFGLEIGHVLTLSLGMDHMKYVIDRTQPTLISGRIDGSVSPEFEGVYNFDPIELTPDLLMLEHTDGLNYAFFGLSARKSLLRFWKKRIVVEGSAGAEAGFVIPRSDVRVFGDGLNNDFHIAGYGYSGKMGLRTLFFDRFFFELQGKGGYMTLPAVLIRNNAVDLIQHNFGFMQVAWSAGAKFDLRPKSHKIYR